MMDEELGGLEETAAETPEWDSLPETAPADGALDALDETEAPAEAPAEDLSGLSALDEPPETEPAPETDAWDCLSEVPPAGGTLDAMDDYMETHGYTEADFDTYSKDPAWQSLNEELLSAEETTELPDRGFDDYEQTLIAEDPEFQDILEGGTFYQQGVNAYGFEGTCGETSQANAVNALLGTNEWTENKVLDVAVQNGLCVTDSLDPAEQGGTTTDEFMELYGKINEQTGGKLDCRLEEFGDAPSVEEMADRLDGGSVLNVAVDSGTLWGQTTGGVNEFGEEVGDAPSDHWITVTGAERAEDGTLTGFDVIDSGGGVSRLDADAFAQCCFGSPGHRVLDPTCITVSRSGGEEGQHE